jgi:hypothetical protein
VSGRRSTATETHEHDPGFGHIDLKSKVVNVSGCEIRLRGVALAVLTERFGATASPVGIIRGPDLHRKIPNVTRNTYVCSQQMQPRMERVCESGGISWSDGSRQIDR